MTNPGSDLARLRKTGVRVCAVCGKAFIARLAAVYCSAACRMAAAYERRKKGKLKMDGATPNLHHQKPSPKKLLATR